MKDIEILGVGCCNTLDSNPERKGKSPPKARRKEPEWAPNPLVSSHSWDSTSTKSSMNSVQFVKITLVYSSVDVTM